MGRRIVGVIVLVVIVCFAYYAYKHRQEEKALESGDFHCIGCDTPEQHAQFLKGNAGETADGQSERKMHTAAEDGKTNYTEPATANTNATPTQPTAPVVTQSFPSSTNDQVRNNMPVMEAQGSQPISMTAPTMDSQGANAPNGMRFAGSGSYEWYRQGNLTWRVNTRNGYSCIVYATMEEWQKQIVMSHGCGRNA